MSILTAALYNLLSSDATLTALLATYDGDPAIFTAGRVPENAALPYIVTTGEVSQAPFDSKVCRGRSMIRDIRCYTAETGSALEVEAIAERVRYLTHRQPLTISEFIWEISDVSGPIVADESDVYGRILSLSVIAFEA